MKKLVKFVLLVVIVMILIPSKKYSLEDLISDLHFKDVVNTFYSNSEIVNKNAIKNGNTYQISTSLEEIDSVKKQLSNIQGQSLSFSGNSEDFSFLENLLFDKICFTESFDNIKVCYGFNNKLSSSVDIDGKKINIQMAINKNNIVIGTPVILGSY